MLPSRQHLLQQLSSTSTATYLLARPHTRTYHHSSCLVAFKAPRIGNVVAAPHHSRRELHCSTTRASHRRDSVAGTTPAMAASAYADVPVPDKCYADFCLVPVCLPILHSTLCRHSPFVAIIFSPSSPFHSIIMVNLHTPTTTGRHRQRLCRRRGRRGPAPAPGERADLHDALGRHHVGYVPIPFCPLSLTLRALPSRGESTPYRKSLTLRCVLGAKNRRVVVPGLPRHRTGPHARPPQGRTESADLDEGRDEVCWNFPFALHLSYIALVYNKKNYKHDYSVI